jgi:hypothetical protein
MAPNSLNLALLVACGLTLDVAESYVPASSRRPATAFGSALRSAPPEAATDTDDAFSAFADSLDEDSLFDDDFDDGGYGEDGVPTWQESIDSLLDPATPAAKRQILLSDLLNASDDIRESVQDALAKRKVRL